MSQMTCSIPQDHDDDNESFWVLVNLSIVWSGFTFGHWIRYFGDIWRHFGWSLIWFHYQPIFTFNWHKNGRWATTKIRSQLEKCLIQLHFSAIFIFWSNVWLKWTQTWHSETFWVMLNLASFSTFCNFLAVMDWNITGFVFRGHFELFSIQLHFQLVSTFSQCFGWHGPNYDLIWLLGDIWAILNDIWSGLTFSHFRHFVNISTKIYQKLH